MTRWAFPLAFAILVGSCRGDANKRETPGPGSGSQAAEPGGAARGSTRPTFRLGDSAAPLSYDVKLSIDPSAEEFSGTVSMSISLAEATDEIWMHGRELEVERAQVTVGERTIEAKSETGPNNLLGFRLGETLGPGTITLEVTYRGRIVRRDGSGIFAEMEGGQWYQYTQFESLDARRAFPCFDEPRWKTPWKLAITTAKDLVVVANTKIATDTARGDLHTVVFNETKPLPTYLVAFAVGNFDFVDAGTSKQGTPLRIVTPKGLAAEAAYAAKVSREILDRLETFFGRPYPYDKLDTLIIPATQGFGAMEHPGLITFASRLALWRADQDTYERQRRFSLVQVHEMGHQWFGNLVTMPWWDDIWLNEAFASWIENRVLPGWRPDWKLEALSVENKEEAMLADSLGSARRIREPVGDESGIESAFDDITYLKGESVLRMFETYVGPDPWRAGIIAYLAKYEWKTATSRDFIEAVESATGKAIAAPFDTFLEQNGVPLVAMRLSCDPDMPPQLYLEQSRYLPIGSKAAANARQWQLPICVTHSRGEACTLLFERKGVVDLGAAGEACPTWINPNKDGVGYYRADVGEEQRAALRASSAKLSLAERLSLAGDLGALVGAGKASLDEGAKVIEALAASTDPIIVGAAVSLAWTLEPMIDAAKRPAYAAFIRKTFAPALKRVGMNPKRGEAMHAALLRPNLWELLGALGEDPPSMTTALREANRWLDGQVIDASLLETVLQLAARGGNAALFERLAARAKASTNRIERRALLRAIGHFRGAETDRSLALAVSPEIDARDSREILEAAAKWPETEEAAARFVIDNYAQIAERLSESQLAFLPGAFAHVCDGKLRAQLAGFLTDKSAALPGGALELTQTLERIDLCIAGRVSHSQRGARFLAP